MFYHLRAILIYMFVVLLMSCSQSGDSANNEDPVQPFINEYNRIFEGLDPSCSSSGETLAYRPGVRTPRNIFVSEDNYDQLRSNQFRFDLNKGVIFTGHNHPLMYYRDYDFRNVTAGCFANMITRSMYPSPKNDQKEAAVRLTAYKENSMEAVFFFRHYFYRVLENGSVVFSGPPYDADIRFNNSGLKARNLKNRVDLTRNILDMRSGRHLAALGWLADAIGIELSEEDKIKFFKNRPFYTTVYETTARTYKQVPVVSLLNTRLGFLRWPKFPRERRLLDQSEQHYLHAVAAANMISSFGRRFAETNTKNFSDIKLAMRLIIDPNSLFEIMNTSVRARKLVKRLGLTPSVSLEENPQKAQQILDALVDRLKKNIARQAKKKRKALKSWQDLENQKLDLIHDIASSVAGTLKNYAQLVAGMEAMGSAYGQVGGDMGQAGNNLASVAKSELDKVRGNAKDLVETYKSSLRKVYKSKSYQDAFRFKHPMTQLNQKAYTL